MDEIDKLLNSLNHSPAAPRPASNVARSSIENLLKQIDASPQVAPSPSSDRLFEQLKQERQDSLKQEAQQKQERLEQLKQQRRQALSVRAEEWLKTLDPNSSEGRWFEEFACNYQSQIEAAIDYLEALREVDRD